MAEELAPLVRRLCDDAAIFPPGLKSLEQAVPDHRTHLASEHGELVGPFIVSADRLCDLAPLVEDGEDFAVSVTVPGGVGDISAVCAGIPSGVRLVGLEVVPVGMSGEQVVSTLDDLGLDPGIAVWVEIPRAERREEMIDALAGTRYRAKFRTGGVSADLYPDEEELAAAINACVADGVPFKATAGLHHAIRNTDDRGFEQHGFANILAATHLARQGGSAQLVATILGERDPEVVAELLRLDPAEADQARELFASFGTCNIDEPWAELRQLDLLHEPDL